MNIKSNIITLAFSAGAVWRMAFSYTSAATFPIPDVQIILKNISTLRIVPSNTDKDGYFSVGVPEGIYDMYISDENMAPIKMVTKNGVISGRVVILTDGTTTQDPVPAKPAKKTTKASTTKKVTASSTAIKKISQ